jgi:enoyl-CoA hydratase
MSNDTVIVEREPPIAVVKLNRPQELNALNGSLLEELERVIGELGEDHGIGGLVLTGNHEKSFSAGADVEELSRLDAVSARRAARRGQRLLRRIETLGKPVVAAVNGFALGGGCELAMACTLRVASERARLGQPEVNLGIIPGYAGTQRLPRLVGKGRALDLILTGRIVKAEEALDMGLVNRVVPHEEVLDASRKVLTTILAKGPRAVEYAMEAVGRGLECSFGDGCALEADLFGLVFATEDRDEGLKAFLEKREARFRGT